MSLGKREKSKGTKNRSITKPFKQKATYRVFLSWVVFSLSANVFAADVIAADSDTANHTVTIAVASNFMVPMKVIAAKFEEESGYQTALAFGASGKLYTQIINGAPFQVFLSADQEKPSALEMNGVAVPGSRYTYALGRLVLWSSNQFVPEQSKQPMPHELEAEPSPSYMFDSLTKHDKLAIANPRLAPYGAAAIEALNKLGIYDQVSEKIVRGENVSQAFQFVETGNAKLGFVALSQVTQVADANERSAWYVPDSFHTPIQQDIVLLSKGANSDAAIAFHSWMKDEQAQTLIQSFGYDSHLVTTGSESAN